MFRKLFGKKRASSEDDLSSQVTARMPCRVMPIDRDDVFGDPLDEALKSAGKGEVTGGGSMQGPEGQITFVDLEIALTEIDDETLDLITLTLDQLNAPKGSYLAAGSMFVEGSAIQDPEAPRLREFGGSEILSIGLDGTAHSDDVYEAFEPDRFVEDVDALLGEKGKFLTSLQGPQFTEFHFAGASYQTMVQTVQPLLDKIEIAKGALVEQVT